MPFRFDFNPDVLNTVAGGRSVLDMPKLHIHTDEAAKSFIESYGFSLVDDRSVQQLFYFHRRAVVLMTERLGFQLKDIPERIREPKKLEDLLSLLKLASLVEVTVGGQKNIESTELQKWACAILRCMHVFVHAEKDLFSAFSQEIQNQIITPFQNAVRMDGSTHKPNLVSATDESKRVELLDFEIKPFKTSTSAVIKLLAKPDAVAMRIYDKIGIRFVTKDLFDSFQVIRFIVDQNLMSFPHIMPDQSSNNLYPVDLFMRGCAKAKNLPRDYSRQDLQKIFDQEISQFGTFRKPNDQSSKDFKFIKFITRKLIHIKPEGKEYFSFFYPFEIQIMDEGSRAESQKGVAVHEAYKERQRQAARARLFPARGAT
jgi:uncharacterized protein (TIGR04562 family)